MKKLKKIKTSKVKDKKLKSVAKPITKPIKKKEPKVIEKSLNTEIKDTKKVDTVPSKLGELILKKNKTDCYDILNKDKKLIGELSPPLYLGKFYLNCWTVRFQTLENKSVLDEVFSNLSSALAYIQKKYSKK